MDGPDGDPDEVTASFDSGWRDEPVPAPTGPARLAVGLGLVVVIGLLLALGPVVLGRGIDGTPIRQDPAAVPPAGTCLGVLRPVPSVVPCDEPHAGEILLAWTGPHADLPLDQIRPAPQQDLMAVLEGNPDFACHILGSGRLSSPVPAREGWYLPGPSVQFQLLAGPRAKDEPAWAWSACVAVAPSYVHLTGSLLPERFSLDASSNSGLRTCYAGVSGTAISCILPHTLELVAEYDLPAEDPLQGELTRRYHAGDLTFGSRPAFAFEDPDLGKQCSELVEQLIGASLHTHQGALNPVLIAFFDGLDEEAQAMHFLVSCTVSSNVQLTGSVSGIGDGPLPTG